MRWLQVCCIHLVVLGAIVSAGLVGFVQRSGERSGPAKVSPVGHAEYIPVVDLPEYHEPRLVATLEVFIKCWRENYRFCRSTDKFLSVLQNSVVIDSGGHGLTWKYQSTPNPISGMARMLCVNKLWPFISFQQCRRYVTFHAQGSRFPSVVDAHWERDLAILNQSGTATAEWHDPSTLIQVERFRLSIDTSRCRIRSFLRGVSRLLKFRVLFDDLSELAAHHVKLSVINAQSDNADESKNAVHYKLSALNPPKLPRKLLGGFLLVCGSIIGIWANFALGWRGWNHWRLSRRLTLGIGGWSIAVVLVCHGTALLLGIN
jgi:hypothetical protein